MYAYEIPGMRFSLPAGAGVAQHRFVSANGDSAGIQATDATAIIGVSMNEAKAGEVLEVADGLVIVEAAGAITAGVKVTSDATGKAVAGDGVAVAITAASGAGELVTVKL